MSRLPIYIAIFLIAILVALTSPVRGTVKSALNRHLVAPVSEPVDGCFDAAYILGGSPASLLLKFHRAAELFRAGRCRLILLPHRSGITEYYPRFKRNLKNDEWSLWKLENLGIPGNNIEIIKINEGFFGTFSEAKTVSALVAKRGYRSLLLITAPFHTRRTKMSFENFLPSHVKLTVLASQEKAGLLELLSESLKLAVYRLFLLAPKDWLQPHYTRST